MVGDREAVLAAGMNDHIAKPIVVDELFAILARWVKPTRPGAAGDDRPRADAALKLRGIDRQFGLANVGGNRDLYRRLLNLFRGHEADFVQRFRTARAAGDADAAMRAAHDLKGEAGTLGMHAMQDAAAALERACLEGAHDSEVDDIVHEVASQLDEVIDELDAMAETSTEGLSAIERAHHQPPASAR
jgi:HPt (histidine-containing phosphotransfer) domain-containing protein